MYVWLHSAQMGKMFFDEAFTFLFFYILISKYMGSPTSTVSTCTITTSTNFQTYYIVKFLLVELQCIKICTSGKWLCSTYLYEFRIVLYFYDLLQNLFQPIVICIILHEIMMRDLPVKKKMCKNYILRLNYLHFCISIYGHLI